MALPPGFLDELRNRVTLSDVAGRKVIWDQRKSNPAKGDFWAPCPFHQEKTPSFHVDDRKGFYYCFGCHAKGDAIGFVKETDNVSFIEAIEILCRDAGMEMPARTHDPQAAEKRDRLSRLAEVMEQAVQAFGLAFRSAGAASVRDYCQGRGLTGATAKRFEIGFAPDSRSHLTQAFSEKGLLEEAVDCGLVIRGDDGSTYDRFRNRLMFPIRDPRGRCIAFGGRAMDPNARAKYLNSPETDLFHKSRVLYNHGPAREAAGKTKALIVAEGYMDVIALAQAGFGHAVAPLGTAITEEQLGMMWKITDEPVIALDGDQAGFRAAERLVDLALPMLAPGKSLRFCLMPEGQDPDDLIKAQGAGAMGDALDNAVPLIDMLWRREIAEPHDTPERRAALDQRLRAALGRIGDASVRNHYAAELRTRRATLFQPSKSPSTADTAAARGRPIFRRNSGPARPTREALSSNLARHAGAAEDARIRESAILLIALHNPDCIEPLEEALDAMTCLGAETGRIRDALMDAQVSGQDLRPHIHAAVGEDPVALLAKVPQARSQPYARSVDDTEAVITVLRDAIARHQAMLAHADEIGEARRDLGEAREDDEGWCVRVRQAHQERLAADSQATAIVREIEQDGEESPFQKMLDSGTWRRDAR